MTTIMMMATTNRFRALSCSLLLLLSLLSVVVVDATPCTSTEKINDCNVLENRVCYQTAAETEVCGQCLSGYVPHLANNGTDDCIAIDDLNLGDYIDAWNPFWVHDGSVNTTERLLLLQATARIVSEHNAQIDPVPLYFLRVGPLATHTRQEKEGLRGVLPVSAESEARVNRLGSFLGNGFGSGADNVPSSIDWVAQGAVTSVKDQGRCGCCWAVSVAGAIEGAAAIGSVDMSFLEDLSFQELISCDTQHQFGCDGGYPTDALQWTNTNGLTSDSQYPFTDADGHTTETCLKDDTNQTVSVTVPLTVTTYSDPDSVSQRISDMKQAVAVQPVSILMDADCDTFYNYGSGILTSDGACRCTSSSRSCLDHAVLMVGYNDEEANGDPKYWKVKNSWGTGWGEEGYYRVSQDGDGDWGLFGVLAQGTVPSSATNLTSDETSGAANVSIPPMGLSWFFMPVTITTILVTLSFWTTM